MRNLLHYLDDSIFVPESLEKASANKQILVNTFSHLGVPLEPSKLEGTAMCLTFVIDLPITPAILKKMTLVRMKDSERIPFNTIMLWAA